MRAQPTYSTNAASEQDERQLLESLHHANTLVAAAQALAVSLDQISLPALPDPPLSHKADQAILKSVGPLYLAMEVERTGLTRALSEAAGLYMTGALRLGQTSKAAELLLDHHRNYERRQSSDDRFAAYLRLFGSAPEGAVPYATDNAVNTPFEDALLRLAEAMHRYANVSPRDLRPTTANREIRTAARLMGEALVMRGGGGALYLAREGLDLVGTATTVFSDRAVQSALGARDLWGAVNATLNLARGGPRRPWSGQHLGTRARAHLARGKSGMMLIEWVAQQAPQLHGIGAIQIPRDASILSHGTTWLQATLSILDAQEGSGHAA